MELIRLRGTALLLVCALSVSVPISSAARELRAGVVPSGRTFQCTPSAIWDGDGPIWCEEGPKVRIAGVAAREMDGSCRTNQPCPSATAIEARDRLVQLLGGSRGVRPEGHIIVHSPTMICRSDGSAGGSRTAAWCYSPIFGDLSCAVVRTGGAVRWARYWRNHPC
jgi:endonuclease YncB( thermonuclease family)